MGHVSPRDGPASHPGSDTPSSLMQQKPLALSSSQWAVPNSSDNPADIATVSVIVKPVKTQLEKKNTYHCHLWLGNRECSCKTNEDHEYSVT
jgi:hypothetical protein